MGSGRISRWIGRGWIGAWTGSGSVSARTSGVLEVSRKSSAEPLSETRLNTRGNGLLRLDRGDRRALDDRLGEGAVRVRTFRAARVLEDRHAGQRRLRKPDAVLVRGHQRVDAEQAEGWRAIDHHEVVLVLAGCELLLEERFAAHLRDELDLRAGELDVRGDEVHAEVAVLDHMSEGDLRIEEQVIQRELDLIGLLEAHVDRQVALGVEVDEEDSLPEFSERATQVHRGGRLANAAFLVGNCDDSAQTVARPLCWNVAAAI